MRLDCLGFGSARSFSAEYGATRIATTSQSPDGTVANAKSPAGSVFWRHACEVSPGSSAASASARLRPQDAARRRRHGAGAEEAAPAEARGLRSRGRTRRGGSATRPCPGKSGGAVCAIDLSLVDGERRLDPRHGGLVLGGGRPRALPDPLELGDEGGRGRVEGDLDPAEGGPGPHGGLLLDGEAAPQQPRRDPGCGAPRSPRRPDPRRRPRHLRGRRRSRARGAAPRAPRRPSARRPLTRGGSSSAGAPRTTARGGPGRGARSPP